MTATGTVAEREMGRQRNDETHADPPGGAGRKFMTFRCYTEQGAKLNELARVCSKPDGGRMTIADVIELLDPQLDEIIARHMEQRLRELRRKK